MGKRSQKIIMNVQEARVNNLAETIGDKVGFKMGRKLALFAKQIADLTIMRVL